AFCFSCVGRSLPPDQQAALILCDVFQFTSREAAEVAGTSEPVLRHRLSDARREMQRHFERLCALVANSGVCYQFDGLRDHTTAAHRGPELPTLTGASEQKYAQRLTIIRDADVEQGRSRALHELLSRALTHFEERAG